MEDFKEATSLTTDDFQNKLVVWFEEKGILSDLRTYLRHQMIESLKKSPIGRKISSKKKGSLSLSPKHQAINLLIAEYLLQQGYEYSMSVFSSEVGTLYSLPEQALRINHQIKFQVRDVCDILEALGLPNEHEEAQSVASAYSQGDGPKECLLLCLLRRLPLALRTKYLGETKRSRDANASTASTRRDAETQTQWEESAAGQQQLEAVLAQIHENMQQAFDHEIEIIREEEKQKYRCALLEQDKLIQEQTDKENSQAKKVENAMQENSRRVALETNRITSEYNTRELELERRLAEELEGERYKTLSVRECRGGIKGSLRGGTTTEASSCLNNAIDLVQAHTNKLNQKEELLDRKLKEVEEKMNKCQQKQIKQNGLGDIVDTERESLESLRQKLEEMTKRMREDEVSKQHQRPTNRHTQTEGVHTTTHCTQTNLAPEPEPTVAHENKMNCSETVESIRKENSHLKILTKEQTNKIEELTLKQMNMSVEIKEAKVQVYQLSKQLGELLSEPLAIPERKRPTREVLSGKKTNKAVKKVDGLSQKHLTAPSSSGDSFLDESHCKNKSRRKKPFCFTKVVRSNSPTDEALKEAKTRLKMLELESEAVDRSYQEFKMRQQTEKKNAKLLASGSSAGKTPFQHKPNTDVGGSCNNSGVDMSIMEEYSSPAYNSFRRVHQSTMNFNKNLLYNYVTENSIKHNFVSTKVPFSNQNNLYPSNHLSTFSGTTALLLKRIENCTTSNTKYNINEKQYNAIRIKSENVPQRFSGENNKIDCNRMKDEYAQYIGRPDQQYKIKPSIHWRNIHKVQRIANQSKGDLSDGMTEGENNICDHILLQGNAQSDVTPVSHPEDGLYHPKSSVSPREELHNPTQLNDLVSGTGTVIVDNTVAYQISQPDASTESFPNSVKDPNRTDRDDKDHSETKAPIINKANSVDIDVIPYYKTYSLAESPIQKDSLKLQCVHDRHKSVDTDEVKGNETINKDGNKSEEMVVPQSSVGDEESERVVLEAIGKQNQESQEDIAEVRKVDLIDGVKRTTSDAAESLSETHSGTVSSRDSISIPKIDDVEDDEFWK